MEISKLKEFWYLIIGVRKWSNCCNAILITKLGRKGIYCSVCGEERYTWITNKNETFWGVLKRLLLLKNI